MLQRHRLLILLIFIALLFIILGIHVHAQDAGSPLPRRRTIINKFGRRSSPDNQIHEHPNAPDDGQIRDDNPNFNGHPLIDRQPIEDQEQREMERSEKDKIAAAGPGENETPLPLVSHLSRRHPKPTPSKEGSDYTENRSMDAEAILNAAVNPNSNANPKSGPSPVPKLGADISEESQNLDVSNEQKLVDLPQSAENELENEQKLTPPSVLDEPKDTKPVLASSDIEPIELENNINVDRNADNIKRNINNDENNSNNNANQVLVKPAEQVDSNDAIVDAKLSTIDKFSSETEEKLDPTLDQPLRPDDNAKGFQEDPNNPLPAHNEVAIDLSPNDVNQIKVQETPVSNEIDNAPNSEVQNVDSQKFDAVSKPIEELPEVNNQNSPIVNNLNDRTDSENQDSPITSLLPRRRSAPRNANPVSKPSEAESNDNNQNSPNVNIPNERENVVSPDAPLSPRRRSARKNSNPAPLSSPRANAVGDNENPNVSNPDTLDEPSTNPLSARNQLRRHRVSSPAARQRIERSSNIEEIAIEAEPKSSESEHKDNELERSSPNLPGDSQQAPLSVRNSERPFARNSRKMDVPSPSTNEDTPKVGQSLADGVVSEEAAAPEETNPVSNEGDNVNTNRQTETDGSEANLNTPQFLKTKNSEGVDENEVPLVESPSNDKPKENTDFSNEDPENPGNQGDNPIFANQPPLFVPDSDPNESPSIKDNEIDSNEISPSDGRTFKDDSPMNELTNNNIEGVVISKDEDQIAAKLTEDEVKLDKNDDNINDVNQIPNKDNTKQAVDDKPDNNSLAAPDVEIAVEDPSNSIETESNEQPIVQTIDEDSENIQSRFLKRRKNRSVVSPAQVETSEEQSFDGVPIQSHGFNDPQPEDEKKDSSLVINGSENDVSSDDVSDSADHDDAKPLKSEDDAGVEDGPVSSEDNEAVDDSDYSHDSSDSDRLPAVKPRWRVASTSATPSHGILTSILLLCALFGTCGFVGLKIKRFVDLHDVRNNFSMGNMLVGRTQNTLSSLSEGMLAAQNKMAKYFNGTSSTSFTPTNNTNNGSSSIRGMTLAKQQPSSSPPNKPISAKAPLVSSGAIKDDRFPQTSPLAFSNDRSLSPLKLTSEDDSHSFAVEIDSPKSGGSVESNQISALDAPPSFPSSPTIIRRPSPVGESRGLQTVTPHVAPSIPNVNEELAKQDDWDSWNSWDDDGENEMTKDDDQELKEL